MATVSISEYWNGWLQLVVDSRVRKSKAEIVEEGLKRIKFGIDREVEEQNEALEIIRDGKTDT